MIARLLIPLLLAAAPLAAQVPADPAPGTVRVTLQTSEGPIVLELEKTRAPITTANFLRYVDAKRFDGTSFYRAAKVGPGYGLIQGGIHYAPKKAFPPIALEPTSKTGLTHGDATISMARGGPATATGDFFITVGAMASMDADPTKPGDNMGFAAFGHVVAGMDVVRRILDAPTAEGGSAAMKGQMLSMPVRIVSARRGEP